MKKYFYVRYVDEEDEEDFYDAPCPFETKEEARAYAEENPIVIERILNPFDVIDDEAITYVFHKIVRY